MKLTKWFWISLLIMIFLFFLPTILTWKAPAYDGYAVSGFPLKFYAWGGLCKTGAGVVCTYPFNTINFILDIVILLAIPLIINYFTSRKT